MTTTRFSIPYGFLAVVLMLLSIVHPVFGLIGLVLMFFKTRWSWFIKVPVLLFVLLLMLMQPTIYSLFAFTKFYGQTRPLQIKGTAMEPGYKNNSYFLSKVLKPGQTNLKRGDVVVFAAPEGSTPAPADFVKRIIALPGETITIQNGQVYINGQVLDESAYLAYSDSTLAKGSAVVEGQPLTVPSGHYFVLGDNRYHSTDSRHWGPIDGSTISALVTTCYQNCD